MAFKPTIAFERVNAATAVEWLKQNTNNRPIRPTEVDRWEYIFENGEYIPTCEGIGFDENGVLIEGQHRLKGLARMPDDFYIYIAVARNLSPLAYEVINDGAKRTSQDRFRMDRCTAQVGDWFARMYYTNRAERTTGKRKLFANFAKPYCDLLMCATPSLQKTFSTTPVRAAAVICMAQGLPSEYVMSVYRALVLADYANMPIIAQGFTRRAQIKHIDASGSPYEAFSKALKVFNPSNANNKHIRVGDVAEVFTDLRELLKSKVVGL